MARVNKRELKRHYQQDRAGCVRQLSQLIESKELRPQDFSIRDLAEALIPNGDEFVLSMRTPGTVTSLLEATTVATSDFSNITGQIVYSMIKEKYESEEFVFSKVVPEVQSEFPGIEKVPGVSQLGDKAEIVEETGKYPYLGVSEDWIEVGEKVKRGFIVPVTREAIAFDRTGVLLDRCGEGGAMFGLNKEKRIIDAFIDGNAGAVSILSKGHRYHWKGTSYATYQASAPWINVKTSNGLTDWTNVEAAEIVLSQITDPYTGEPILVQPDTIIVTPNKLHTAKRVVSATEIRNTNPGFATSGNPMQTTSPNTLANYSILSSRLFAARVAAAGGATTDWYLGNPAKALRYFYNWKMETTQAPAGHSADFDQDIVQQYKVSERATVATVEPRVLLKNTA